jgi:hypothetical protein
MLRGEVIARALRGGGVSTDWGQAMASTNATNGTVSHWIDQQQRRIQQLEDENIELRRQLDDLRRGVGLALVIEGRAIPLAAQPRSRSPQPGDGSPVHAPFAHPDSRALATPNVPDLAVGTASTPPYARAQRASAPINETAPFPEAAWLTDSDAALASPRRRDRLAPTPLRQPTSSQDMTPSWLREDAPAPRHSPPNAAVQTHEARPAQAQAMSQFLSRAQSTGDALATTAHAEPVPLRTLAQITGHQQAVRQRGTADRRNLFSDSFVLG